MKKIFIDGKEGTTGLKIFDRLNELGETELLQLPEELRKDKTARAECINNSDIVFLCLPDAAAKESVSLCENPNTVIIDASTAHRTRPDWAYGFPELSGEHYSKICASKRIAVPGCYATAFISLVYPLVNSGVIPKDYPICANAVSGYSGAGKTGIAEYEEAKKNGYSEQFRGSESPVSYAVYQNHKHIPEMKFVCGLEYDPIFNPMVDDYFSGILMQIPIHTRLLPNRYSSEEILRIYSEYYSGKELITVKTPDGGSRYASNALSGTDSMEIFVFGDDSSDRILLMSRIDNLGKGASGAALQCAKIKIKSCSD